MMSQQHTTQTSGQGLLERVFKLREHGTTARTEVIAGFTTFLTMVYIVFVNPQILGVAGMDTSAVFVTTCLIAALGSILMGVFANLPVALAPAMGLNAFFAFVVVQAMGLPWQVGMGAIFWGAIGLLLLTIFRVRYWMIANIPVSLRVGITSGKRGSSSSGRGVRARASASASLWPGARRCTRNRSSSSSAVVSMPGAGVVL